MATSCTSEPSDGPRETGAREVRGRPRRGARVLAPAGALFLMSRRELLCKRRSVDGELSNGRRGFASTAPTHPSSGPAPSLAGQPASRYAWSIICAATRSRRSLRLRWVNPADHSADSACAVVKRSSKKAAARPVVSASHWPKGAPRPPSAPRARRCAEGGRRSGRRPPRARPTRGSSPRPHRGCCGGTSSGEGEFALRVGDGQPDADGAVIDAQQFGAGGHGFACRTIASSFAFVRCQRSQQATQRIAGAAPSTVGSLVGGEGGPAGGASVGGRRPPDSQTNPCRHQFPCASGGCCQRPAWRTP